MKTQAGFVSVIFVGFCFSYFFRGLQSPTKGWGWSWVYRCQQLTRLIETFRSGKHALLYNSHTWYKAIFITVAWNARELSWLWEKSACLRTRSIAVCIRWDSSTGIGFPKSCFVKGFWLFFFVRFIFLLVWIDQLKFILFLVLNRWCYIYESFSPFLVCV